MAVCVGVNNIDCFLIEYPVDRKVQNNSSRIGVTCDQQLPKYGKDKRTSEGFKGAACRSVVILAQLSVLDFCGCSSCVMIKI